MKISIIIPFREGSHFLRDCLDSLCEQAFTDYEVLLVLDECIEDISWIERDYSGKMKYRILKLVGKTGVAAARNCGIEAAEGEYIYFLDSDDYLYEEALALLVERAEENNSDLVYGKKYSSWFKRSIFLPTFVEMLEQQQLEREAMNEDNDSDDEDEEEFDEDNIELEMEALKEKQKRRAFRFVWNNKKRIKNISVLHLLIKRDLVNNNAIRFNEDFKYYSDIPFVLQLLNKGTFFNRCYVSKYIKRKHNDPINFPSLSQIKDENRFTELIDMYYYCVGLVNKGSYEREQLDKKMIQYYTNYFVRKFRRSDNDAWKNERFEVMHDVAMTIEYSTIKHTRMYARGLMKLLRKNDLKKSINKVNRHMARKKFFRLFRKKHEIAKYFYRHKYLNKPLLDNVIMCESFFGKNYADSPRNIFEYLSENYPGKFKFVWVLDSKTKLPFDAVQVKRFSLKYMYYLACSKYFMFNGRQPVWYKKRDGMVFLETWHGTPLKKLVFDLEEVYSASPLYKKEVFSQSRKWDYLIAANEFSSEVFKSCFMYEGKMLEYGYPRNDILHRKDRDDIAKSVRSKLGIPVGKKTVLYAPTWRDDEFYEKGNYKFTLKLDLELMRKKLGEEYVILLRTHYFIADKLDLSGMEGFAYNLCKYSDIAELYLISDIIITDYSSVFFDYANLKRPMLFYTYDLEKYRDVLRGFYIDIEEELPGPLLFTTDEVIDAIKDIDGVMLRYNKKYSRFYEKFCGWEDGHASENIAKEVFGLK